MTRAATTLPGLTTPRPARSTVARAGHSLSTPAAWQFDGERARAISDRITADNTPTRRYVKDLARAGEYVARGQRISLTESDLDALAANTNKYIAAGNPVPVPDGHTDSATANRGFVREVFREGDTLYGVLEMIGEDGIATASRAKVSIGTDANYTDGKGNVYPHVIRHVALTNAPVIPDQNGFVPLAASLGGSSARALVLSLAQTEQSMESLLKIAAMIGVEGAESMDEAALVESIAKAIEGLRGMSATAKADAEKLKAELSGIRASLDKPAAPPDPVLMRVVGENRAMKLDRLVETGRITPACRDGIAALYVKEDGLKLSLDNESDSRFSALLSALEKNQSTNIGERTRAQGVALSRDAGGTTDPRKAAADLMATIGIKAQ
jgi:hypothetical protein